MRMFQRLVIEDRTTGKVIREIPVQSGGAGLKTLESALEYFERLGGEARMRRYWSTDTYWGSAVQ